MRRFYAAISRTLADAFRRPPDLGAPSESTPLRICVCACECRSAGGYQWLYPGLIVPMGGLGDGGCACAGRECEVRAPFGGVDVRIRPLSAQVPEPEANPCFLGRAAGSPAMASATRRMATSAAGSAPPNSMKSWIISEK